MLLKYALLPYILQIREESDFNLCFIGKISIALQDVSYNASP